MTNKPFLETEKSRLPVYLLIGTILIGVLSFQIQTRVTLAATDASPFLKVYNIPTANSEPTNIITVGPGQVWYTLQNANAIGKLVVTNGNASFNQYSPPTANSAPYDLAYDGQFIWFTERQGNKIGRLNPATGAITEYPIPTPNSEPMGIAISPNGHVWFVERTGNKIARFKPASGTFDEYAYTVAGAFPEDVATSSDDSIWFTAPGLNLVVHFMPDKAPSQRFEPAPVLDFGLQPWPPARIAVLSDIPWITAPSKDFVGRYAPGTLNYWRWFELVNDGTGVRGIYLQRSGNRYLTWFTEPEGNRIGLLMSHSDSANVITLFEQPLPGINSQPEGITVDSSGTAWITAPGANAIISWTRPYYYQLFAPAVNK